MNLIFRRFALGIIFSLLVLSGALLAQAQTTEFTYQGKLDVTGTTSATYDFEFVLCDTVDCDSVLDANLRPGVPVVGGVFTVRLNFGAEFSSGQERFLEIRVKRPGESNYTALLPRQKMTSVPNSMFSLEAATATNSLKLGNVAANQFVLTNDSRLNASNYVQNTTSAQPTANFNIGGTGTANVFNAASGFNIGGQRVLSVSTDGESDNLFVGLQSGGSTTGYRNSFVGSFAGNVNSIGNENSFFGNAAGIKNSAGNNNSFFGYAAGLENITGSNNVFIGTLTGNPDPSAQVNNSVAIGSNAKVSTSNTIVLGTSAETTSIPGKLLVGSEPKILSGIGNMESFNSNGISGLFLGNLILRGIDSELASPVHLCIRTRTITTIGGGATGGQALTRCSSSFASEDNKTDVKSFAGGLDVIKRLKPVAFKWKADGTGDVGLNAEDVAEIEPNLVTRDAKGKVEDVKEHSLNVLFINAFKEQQTQIEQQQREINELKAIVCTLKTDAAICKGIN